jgi:protein SCO1/2
MMRALLVALGLALTVPSGSLYQLEGRFEDAQGVTHSLPELQGHPTLFAMFYATCPQACPRLIADVQAVLAQLDAADRARVRVVLVSLDPAHDTPAVLAATQRARGLDTSWTLLRSDAETTRALATALGVHYRAQGDGTIEHSSKVVLLDRAGIPIEQAITGNPKDGLLARLRAQLALPR